MGTQFQQKSWDLTDILPAHSGPEFETEVQKLKDDVQQLESMKGKLSPQMSVDDLVSALKLYEKIQENKARFKDYAFMFFTEDTSNQIANAFKSQMETLDADVTNRTLFFEHWLIRLDDKTHDRLVPNLEGDFRFYIEKLRKKKPHILDERVEKAFKDKDVSGVNALVQLYNLITSGLQYSVRTNGEMKELTRGQIEKLWFSPNPNERQASYEAFYRQFAKNANLLGEIYRHRIMDWHTENIKYRHYPSPISVFNLENDVSDEVVDLVLSTCRKNYGVSRDFFSQKARLLGIEGMNRYHLYAPLGKIEKTIPYPEAVDLVLETFSSFDEKMGRLARRVFELHHVDSEIRLNKSAGAYCDIVNTKIVPYLFMNYTGSIPHVFALAHETGHAVHDTLLSVHSQLVFESPKPISELASRFAELLLQEKLLEKETDTQMKQNLLAFDLTRCYTAIQRQAAFAIFEKDAHDAIAKGVTIDELANLYFSNLKEQFGNVVHVPENFKWEWETASYICERPFYSYSYAFANLLALAFYNRFKKEGESFKSKYMNLLSYGGSESPEKMLTEVGVNIHSEKFWQGGFDAIAGMVSQLEKYK